MKCTVRNNSLEGKKGLWNERYLDSYRAESNLEWRGKQKPEGDWSLAYPETSKPSFLMFCSAHRAKFVIGLSSSRGLRCIFVCELFAEYSLLWDIHQLLQIAEPSFGTRIDVRLRIRIFRGEKRVVSCWVIKISCNSFLRNPSLWF